MKKIGYVRVSTRTQETERQVEALQRVGVSQIYEEKVSGTVPPLERKQFKMMIDNIKEGDWLVLESVSRLGRSFLDSVTVFFMLREMGINIHLVSEHMELRADEEITATQEFLVCVLALSAQLERDLTSERTQNTIKIKREKKAEKGEVFRIGRKKKYNKKTESEVLDLRRDGYTIMEISDIMDIPKSVVGRMLKGEY